MEGSPMIDNAAAAAVLLLFLSTAIERAVEVALAGLEDRGGPTFRRGVATMLALLAAAALSFGLGLDLVGPLLPASSLTSLQGQSLTAIALAGGSAPAHELLRLLEEAKNRLKAVP
jgi:hypothetical protein